MFKKLVCTKSFSKDWQRAGLIDDEMTKLESAVFKDPKIGVLIKETKGLRKVRWARPGSGKSGGVRVFYYCVMDEVLYLLACILKNEEENLSKQERNEFAKLLQALEMQRKKGE
jgi:hypothetical protein